MSYLNIYFIDWSSFWNSKWKTKKWSMKLTIFYQRYHDTAFPSKVLHFVYSTQDCNFSQWVLLGKFKKWRSQWESFVCEHWFSRILNCLIILNILLCFKLWSNPASLKWIHCKWKHCLKQWEWHNVSLAHFENFYENTNFAL